MDQTFVIRSKENRSVALKAVSEITSEPLMCVIIKPYEKTRSDEQNRKIHALFSEIAQQTGYSPAEIKQMCKRDILGSRVVEYKGQRYEVLQETHRMSIKDMIDFIDHIYVWCSERGIQVS